MFICSFLFVLWFMWGQQSWPPWPQHQLCHIDYSWWVGHCHQSLYVPINIKYCLKHIFPTHGVLDRTKLWVQLAIPMLFWLPRNSTISAKVAPRAERIDLEVGWLRLEVVFRLWTRENIGRWYWAMSCNVLKFSTHINRCHFHRQLMN